MPPVGGGPDGVESLRVALTWARLMEQEWRAKGHKIEKEFSVLRNDFDVRMAPHVSDGEFKGMSCGAYFGLSVLRVMVGLATAPKIAVTGELSLDGTLRPVDDADIKYKAVTKGMVTNLILPLKNKNEIIDSDLYDAPSVEAADSMEELVQKIMLPLAPAHAMHRRGVNQPKIHAVPDFFLSLPKPKHDLVSLMVTEYAITDDGVISDLQSVEVCVVFGGGRKIIVTGAQLLREESELHNYMYQVKLFLSGQWSVLRRAMQGTTFYLDYTTMVRLQAHPWYCQDLDNLLKLHVNFPTTSIKKMSGHYALAIALAFIAISTPDLVLRRDVLFLGELATGRAVVPARHIHETELEIARDNGMSLVFVPYANIQELRNDLIVTDAGYFEDVKIISVESIYDVLEHAFKPKEEEADMEL